MLRFVAGRGPLCASRLLLSEWWCCCYYPAPVLLQATQLCGAANLLLYYLFIGLWVQKGGVVHYWETAMHPLEASEHSICSSYSHSSDCWLPNPTCVLPSSLKIKPRFLAGHKIILSRTTPRVLSPLQLGVATTWGRQGEEVEGAWVSREEQWPGNPRFTILWISFMWKNKMSCIWAFVIVGFRYIQPTLSVIDTVGPILISSGYHIVKFCSVTVTPA